MVTQGRVVERVFAGSQERIRIEVDALRGARPVNPPPAYGASKTIIEAFQPSSGGESILMPGERVWIGVHSYHVLAPTGLRLLICSQETLAGESVLRTGAGLAELAEGPVTLMTVVESEKDMMAVREQLELLNKDLLQKLPNAETKIRKGSAVEQILLEAFEGNYEIAVIGSSGTRPGFSSPRLGSVAQQLITRAGIPVLIVSDPREKIRRVLICTAAGEPGKSDVRFGGRVARQLRAHATVLHVRPRNAPGWANLRAERHLNQARSSLEAIEVRTEIKITEREPLLEGILEEAESGDFDLIVVGAPLQPHRGQTHWTDLTSRIIERCRRPVLVVPMTE
jgi:nucleotide-binding universal stress UspA family protein